MSRSLSPRLTIACLAALSCGLVLAGCAQTAAPEPTQTSAPAPEPTQTSAPDPASLTCDDILPTSVLDSALGASFTLNSDFVPQTGSAGSELAAAGGVACEWTDGAGATVLVAAGEPGPTVIEAAKAEASRAGTATDVFGASLTGFASGASGSTIDVFSESGAWVQTTSTLYSSPSDAVSIVEQIMQALPSG
ncbi:hypothetical protein [Microbacterium sp. RU33B]|uniref:hypothetical protein n=1 Tax=Microbacterium sp. RU33B TaxID=1907390 RepID=UPI000962081C|nr:hypothetical protein [Microbacterium sp. RU33B]SIT66529.1 hypothetical protein SAMN05880545_0007 [Microbacterium sp. RU33B]